MDTTPNLPHNDWLVQLLKKHLTELGIWNQKNVFLFVNALIQSQHISQTKIAVNCSSPVKPTSDLRKFQRFLSQKIDVSKLENQWVKCVFETIKKEDNNKNNKVVLIVDETARKNCLKVMIVSLAYKGRMIPLLWKVYKNEESRQQSKMILEMIQNVKSSCGSQMRILVLADRGIGNSPELLRGLESLGVNYLVRVTNLVQLRIASKQVSLTSLCTEPGQEGSLIDILAFKKAGWLPCHAYWCWSESHKESWLLLSNDPELSASCYAMRMWIELGIRDFKSSGWHWEESRITDTSRCWLQWFIMSVASLFVSALGTWLSEGKDLLCGLSRGKTSLNRRSVFRLGLDFLVVLEKRGSHWLASQFSNQEEIDKDYFGLVLAYPTLLSKASSKTVAQ